MISLHLLKLLHRYLKLHPCPDLGMFFMLFYFLIHVWGSIHPASQSYSPASSYRLHSLSSSSSTRLLNQGKTWTHKIQVTKVKYRVSRSCRQNIGINWDLKWTFDLGNSNWQNHLTIKVLKTETNYYCHYQLICGLSQWLVYKIWGNQRTLLLISALVDLVAILELEEWIMNRNDP